MRLTVPLFPHLAVLGSYCLTCCGKHITSMLCVVAPGLPFGPNSRALPT